MREKAFPVMEVFKYRKLKNKGTNFPCRRTCKAQNSETRMQNFRGKQQRK